MFVYGILPPILQKLLHWVGYIWITVVSSYVAQRLEAQVWVFPGFLHQRGTPCYGAERLCRTRRVVRVFLISVS